MSLRAHITKVPKKLDTYTPNFKRYKPKKGHVVQTIRGPRVAGQIIKIHNKRSVDFKSANGKIFRAHIHNVKRAEAIPYIPEEMLTELHKRTLGSYITKAVDAVSNRAFIGGVKYAEQGHLAEPTHKEAKRVKGIKNAAKKMATSNESTKPTKLTETYSIHHASAMTPSGSRTVSGFPDAASAIRHATKLAKERRKTVTVSKGGNTFHHVDPKGRVTHVESFEPVQELRKTTLVSYISRAADDVKRGVYLHGFQNGVEHKKGVPKSLEDEKTRHRREKGIETAARYLAFGRHVKKSNTMVKPAGRSKWREAKEEVVNELSPSTLRSYITKAKLDFKHHVAIAKDAKHDRSRRIGRALMAIQRNRGIAKARSSLWKKLPTEKAKSVVSNEEIVTELQSSTLRSYVGKSVKSAEAHHKRAGELRAKASVSGGASNSTNDSTLARAKWNTSREHARLRGIHNATGKLAHVTPKPAAQVSAPAPEKKAEKPAQSSSTAPEKKSPAAKPKRKVGLLKKVLNTAQSAAKAVVQSGQIPKE